MLKPEKLSDSCKLPIEASNFFESEGDQIWSIGNKDMNFYILDTFRRRINHNHVIIKNS